MADTPDRSELRRLADEATARPWRISEGGMSRVVVSGHGHGLRPVSECWAENSHADAALIAAAVNALPALLDALDSRDRMIRGLVRHSADCGHTECAVTAARAALGGSDDATGG